VNAFVLTVSDRSAAGDRLDTSGPLAAELLQALGFTTRVAVVPDDLAAVAEAIREAADADVDLVLTTGGTGLGPRDITPEATIAVLERRADGLAEAVRAAGSVPTAVLSRGVAGTVGTTLVVNLAGSPGAVRDGLSALGPLLPHAVAMMRGGDH
jgi:molybdenum cofactor synthesis domain-containing protein